MKQEVIELKPFMTKTAEVTIVGDGDLVLNKMNDVTVRNLTQERKGKAKDTEGQISGRKSSHPSIGLMESRMIFRKKDSFMPLQIMLRVLQLLG